MSIWFLILLVLNFLSLGIHLAKHGEPRTGNYNRIEALISGGVALFLYYKLGLF